MHWMTGFGIGGWLMMFVFWGGFIALIYLAVAAFMRNGDTPHSQSPEEIARLRYARGEITREEYLALIEGLTHKSA